VATYYVATTGDNADPGTLAEPWETITYAESQVSAGDTVYIRAGTYDEGEISITENGTPGQDITFRAYGSEEVILQKGAGDDFIFDCTADYRIFQGFELDSEDARSVVRLDGDYDQLLDCDLHDASWWAMVDVGGDHCTVDHCTFLNNYVAVDEDAAGVGCSGGQAYLTVSFCTFENMRGDGIIVDHNTGTPGVDYDGFSFHDNEIFPGAGNQLCCEGGIDVKRGNGECYNNYIHDYRATDQSCGGTGSNGEAIFLHGTDVNSWVVRDNIIENCTIGIWLTSGIEADVYRNVIFDSPAADANADATGNVGVAIYIQDAPSDIDIWNNTFVDCDGKTIWLSDATVDIKNNIFDGCGDYDEDGAPTVTADYNCWNNCSSSTAGGNDVNDDPEFTDRAGDDFTLQSTSPCIDVGTDVGLEYEGTAPDLGAYEYEPPESPAEEAHIIPVGGVGLPDRRKRNLYDSAITYEVWLSDQFGTRIALLDSFERLRWSRVANGVGQVEIVFAPEKFHRDQWWGLDRRLEVWRAPIDGGLRLERIYFRLGRVLQGRNGRRRDEGIRGGEPGRECGRRAGYHRARLQHPGGPERGRDGGQGGQPAESADRASGAGRILTPARDTAVLRYRASDARHVPISDIHRPTWSGQDAWQRSESDHPRARDGQSPESKPHTGLAAGGHLWLWSRAGTGGESAGHRDE